MLFAAYPGPTGYAPPPKKSANPVVIVLGICGGCALVAVIAGVILFVIGKQKLGPFVQRAMTGAQFTMDLKLQKYSDAEKYLTPQLQQEYSAEALEKKVKTLEKKYGPLTGIAQVNTVDQTQPDPTKINNVKYNLNFQNGVVAMKMTFDTSPGQETKIAQLDWGADEGSGSGGGSGSGSGSGSGGSSGSGHGSGSGGSNQ